MAEAWCRERLVTVGALCVAATTERCGTVADIKLRAIRTMKIAINDSARMVGLRLAAQSRARVDVLGALVADVDTDISVAARDL